jgi:integrase/recombinase XerD
MADQEKQPTSEILPHRKEFLDFLLLERGLSRLTIRAYCTDLDKLWGFLRGQGVVSLEAVTREDLRDFLEREEAQGMGARTRARELVSGKAFFHFLRLKKLLPIDVTELMGAPRLPKTVPQALSEEETHRLLAVYDNPPTEKDRPRYLRNRCILAFLYATGLRVSELCSLRMASLDSDRGVLRVQGKGGKERVVPFDQHANHALQEYLQDGRPALDRTKRSPYILLNLEGRPMNRRSVWEVTDEAGHLAGIRQQVHPHLLRHSFATHLLAHGADIRSIQELLGHASVATTQVYLSAEASRMKEAFERFHPRAKE